MTYWDSQKNNVIEDASQFFQDLPRKSYTKIDPIGKLHVIHALDNGQSKADVAREYGVHPQTIAYIYKQKESLIKKYTQKYNLLKEVRAVNLDQTLLDWLEFQFKNGTIIKEEQLCEKAQEIVNTLSEEFNCIDCRDWLLDFRIRHNIVKYNPEVECSVEAKEEWDRFVKGLDIKDLYVGGVCALSHSLDLHSYVGGKKDDDYVSLLLLFKSSGSDKREVIVASKEKRKEVLKANIKSLPVTYYCCNTPQVNQSIIVDYLTKWDTELKCIGKKIVLSLNIPHDMLKEINFENIKVVNATNLDFFTKAIDKVVECFKFHFRRLQIIKRFNHGKSHHEKLLDYVHTISSAWYAVPCKYICRLFWPPKPGSLYFNINDDNDRNHSLSQWCSMCSIPLNMELNSKTIDTFIVCDKQLQSINLSHSEGNDTENINKFLVEKSLEPTSGMESYQAMKRLVSYLQAESAQQSIMEAAKSLENHCEYGALVEMHKIIAKINETE